MRTVTARDRVSEVAAMLLIGEGMLATWKPSSHCSLWRTQNGWWGSMVDWFADRPVLVRGLGGVEFAAGLWLAYRQYRYLGGAPDHTADERDGIAA